MSGTDAAQSSHGADRPSNNDTRTLSCWPEALALFERNKKDDRLVQDKHHKEVAGRHFSDILGVLGDELQSPSDCPERIMPLWLAHTASRLFRAQPLDRAKEWGLQFYAELKRLDGKLPFTVIHDWHANVVEPFAIKFSKRRGPNPWRYVERPKAFAKSACKSSKP